MLAAQLRHRDFLQAAGIPTGGALLSPAEHAGLDASIDGLKASRDRVGIQVATASVPVISDSAPAPSPSSGGLRPSVDQRFGPVLVVR